MDGGLKLKAQSAPQSEWREVTIGDIVEIKHGYAFKGRNIYDSPTENCDVLLTPGNFAVGGGFKEDRFKYYDGHVPDQFVLSKGDLVVTMTDLSKLSDTLGYPVLVPECPEGRRFLHNQRLGKISPVGTSAVDTKYLYYVMCTSEYRDEVLAGATGTAIKHTSPDRIKKFAFRLPPLPEQRAIAAILGALDDKIELNRRMNRTLEAMARAVFQDWFVDFGPVRAKQEGRQPYLPPELWALFPGRLAPTELGEAPEGWAVKALGEVVEVARGLSYKGAGLASDGMPMHNLNSVYEGGGYKYDGIKYYNGDFQERHVTQPGDVLVANTEQGHDRLLIGFAAIVPESSGEHGLFSHHLYRVQPKTSSGLSADFLCQLFNTQSMHDVVSGYATGTTVNMLPVDALRIPGIILPPSQLVLNFTSIAETYRSRQDELIEESRALAAQRDALLPRLVSGELGVV